ncbi:E3 ubiquitin-protein ligase [Lachnellula occidentalis]|uniref:E3 ubiquitin-protein ligase n=1 Tax=Lachnellula occidentalis TaxID=215460 RepID=A0A8H8U743_9HELO|nr:E3 ubiquitin-protein ligase [Lachnellula occidentalis]
MAVVTMSGSGAAAQGFDPAGDEMQLDQSTPTSPSEVSGQEFDLDEAIMQLAGPVIDRKGEPVITGSVAASMDKSIRSVALNYMRAAKGSREALQKITEEQLDDVKLWLYGVYSLEDVNNSKFLLNVKNVLLRMQSSDIQFPAQYQQIAAALSDKFITVLETPEPDSAAPAASSNTVKAPKSSGAPKAPGEVVKCAPKQKAHPNHPIFGDKGIMHGIWVQKKKSTSYSVDEAHKVDFHVFGHNGLAVGQVWPLMVAAFRDGAHGHRVAGISGSGAGGCYSVVISGTYSDVDKDYGETIKYSSPGSLEADSKADKTSSGTSALLRSIVTGQPIRVLRSAGGHWDGKPSMGFRYDGLYSAESSTEVTKRDGGSYVQFSLRRQGGQPPIDKARPNIEERKQFKLAKAGF